MIETFDSTLMKLALGGLALSGLLFAAAFAAPYVKAAWDRASKFARAVFCCAVVCACLFGGAKHKTGGITYPKTDNEIAYLTDAGSYVTNDAVHVAFTRLPMVPSSATFYLDYCALDGTNEQGVATNWVNAKTATFGDLSVPFDFAFANATNYNWMAYTDWTPGPAVQTNGVWHAYWGIDKKEGRYFIPVRTCVRNGGEVIATPKSKWDAKDPMELTEAEAYERYAPDTAYVVNVEAGDYVDLQIVSWAGGTADSDKWVDWGDGTREVVTGSIPKHTYEASGNYVVRISSNCTGFRAGWYNNVLSGHKYIVRVLRFGDNVNYYYGIFRKCARATCFPDGKLPRWSKAAASVKTFDSVYEGCTSLAATELPAWPSSLTSATSVFNGCKSLAVTELPAWPASLTSAISMFNGCTSLAATELPAWPSSLTSADCTFYNCRNLTSAWTDDPAELMPTNITSHGSCVSGTSDALRALFYSDWGGTRTKTE